MPRYTALELNPNFEPLDLTLSRSLWTPGQTFAEYVSARSKVNLRVAFKQVEILRIVDDLSVLDKESTPSEGIDRHHFAYTVVGSAFWDANADTIADSVDPLTQYRFITGNSCVDVIASTSPHFGIMGVAY
jgi:hypothetical protein